MKAVSCCFNCSIVDESGLEGQSIPGALIFTINVDAFLPRMQAALDGHRQVLIESKDLVGWRYEDGLWGDVQIELQIIDKRRDAANG